MNFKKRRKKLEYELKYVYKTILLTFIGICQRLQQTRGGGCSNSLAWYVTSRHTMDGWFQHDITLPNTSWANV